MERLMSQETIQGFCMVTVIVGIYSILITLHKILAMYSKSQESQAREPLKRLIYDDIHDIKFELRGLNGQMHELLKREEEKRNVLKENEGESKALLEHLVRSVDRLCK